MRACVQSVLFFNSFASWVPSLCSVLCIVVWACPCVCLFVRSSVYLSVCTHTRVLAGRKTDSYTESARNQSCSNGWWELENCNYFFFVLSFFLCMHAICLSVCLPAWMYTHMIVRMKARAHTYQPPDRQKVWLSDRQTDRQTDPTRMYYEKEPASQSCCMRFLARLISSKCKGTT